MHIIDAFMWSYEVEAVKIRLANLDMPHVAVQATNTFRGEPREVKKLDLPGVIDVIVTIPDGLGVWESEEWLRNEVLNQAVKIYGEDALYLVADGDEIPSSDAINEYSGKPLRLMTDYRNFYANLRAVDHVLHVQPTLASFQQYMTVGGAHNARNKGWRKSRSIGWHLSSLGDIKAIKEKLSTYSHTEYDSDEFKDGLEAARDSNRDFLNRFDMEITDDIPNGVPKHLLKP